MRKSVKPFSEICPCQTSPPKIAPAPILFVIRSVPEIHPYAVPLLKSVSSPPLPSNPSRPAPSPSQPP
jgi:hypothetical protein